MNSADLCRERGWTVGDVLIDSHGSTEYAREITAIGDESILLRCIAFRRDEGSWQACTTSEAHRYYAPLWTLATPEQLAARRGFRRWRSCSGAVVRRQSGRGGSGGDRWR